MQTLQQTELWVRPCKPMLHCGYFAPTCRYSASNNFGWIPPIEWINNGFRAGIGMRAKPEGFLKVTQSPQSRSPSIRWQGCPAWAKLVWAYWLILVRLRNCNFKCEPVAFSDRPKLLVCICNFLTNASIDRNFVVARQMSNGPSSDSLLFWEAGAIGLCSIRSTPQLAIPTANKSTPDGHLISQIDTRK